MRDVGCDAFKIFCSGHYVCPTVSNTWIIGCLVVLRSLFMLDVECSPSLRILCSDDYVCGTVSNTRIIGCPVVFRSLFTLNVECPAAFRISFLVITSVLPSAILWSSIAWFFCGHCSYWMWNVLLTSRFYVFMISSVLQSAILALSVVFFPIKLYFIFSGKCNSTCTRWRHQWWEFCQYGCRKY